MKFIFYGIWSCLNHRSKQGVFLDVDFDYICYDGHNFLTLVYMKIQYTRDIFNLGHSKTVYI